MPRLTFSYTLRAWTFVLTAALTFAACDTVDPGLDTGSPLDPTTIDSPLGGITAAPAFDFATTQQVGLTLTEAEAGVPTRYDVWRIGTDGAR
ncbi:MAG: hypothetical protein AAF624_17290, partial [Bacteroidota bacterium]